MNEGEKHCFGVLREQQEVMGSSQVLECRNSPFQTWCQLRMFLCQCHSPTHLPPASGSVIQVMFSTKCLVFFFKNPQMYQIQSVLHQIDNTKRFKIAKQQRRPSLVGIDSNGINFSLFQILGVDKNLKELNILTLHT